MLLLGKPKTHKEVAERFNIVYEVKEVLRKSPRK